MTFKHAKFEDSVIMRSLEKVAREKGMIKDDPIQKTASTQIDLKPSDSLMQNILTLCAGLRAQGFDKHANELEVNFLAYKQATNALYETDPKAGEKQIRDAHPKGSPKLEGVEGGDLAVVETVIDEHLKLLDIVNKKPTGKLASSSDVLSAVKMALAQGAELAVEEEEEDPGSLEKSESGVREGLKRASALWDEVNTTVKASGGLAGGFLVGRGAEYSITANKISERFAAAISSSFIATYDNIEKLQSLVVQARRYIEPGVTLQSFNPLGGVSTGVWKEVAPKIETIIGILESAKEIKGAVSARTHSKKRPAIRPAAPPAAKPAVVSETATKINNALSQFRDLETLINVDNDPANADDKAKALAWVRPRITQLTTLKATFDKKSLAEQNQSAADFTAAVNKITANYNAVRQQWV